MTIHQHDHTHHTIHDMKNHMHYGWDRDLSPILEVEPGQTVSFDIVDASGGQLSRKSNAETLKELDFATINPVCGPVYVKGAEPGDTLEVEMIDFRSLEWGWTGVIPGFGLLAEEFKDPLLKTYDLDQSEQSRVFTGD